MSYPNKFLQTYELSTEIIKLISSTESYCYIVSPYIKLWPQLDRVLNIASKNNVFLTFIIRQEAKSDELVRKLNGEYGFEVFVIKDLHIKLYLNEKRCILSSMNLYDASQQNNLELGYEIGNSLSVKKELIEEYILLDKSTQHHKGKFEHERSQLLDLVKEAKEKLQHNGFCVVCQGEMESDFNPFSPWKVRCRNCYDMEENRYSAIKFCHYCGKEHEASRDKPFHYDCTQVLKKARKLTKPYVKHY